VEHWSCFPGTIADLVASNSVQWKTKILELYDIITQNIVAPLDVIRYACIHIHRERETSLVSHGCHDLLAPRVLNNWTRFHHGLHLTSSETSEPFLAVH